MNCRSILSILMLVTAPLLAQEQSKPTLAEATAAIQTRLTDSVAELAQQRQQQTAAIVPLSRQLAELEAELVRVRQQYQEQSRLVDGRALELTNLRTEIAAGKEEATYLGNLLGEYLRAFESRLHIAELQRHREVVEQARLAADNTRMDPKDVFTAQAAVLGAALERLDDALGGARFAGSAVEPNGTMTKGTFVLIGPAALFRSDDGRVVGTAEQRLGSLEPAVIPFDKPEDRAAAEQLITSGAGRFPFDASQGNAHKIEAIQETLWQHILKGGPVMWPILGIAALALLVALWKWLRLTLVRSPSQTSIEALLEAMSRRDRDGVRHAAEAVRGPTGRMLQSGVEHLQEPRELVEEVMYETVLSTRLQLQSMLPFIAITAASAPLLGLLGTVTGIMNTFTLMTVFGTGDVKTLSSGISEALITTEFGLYVAIPSLILHAFLSRKCKRIIDDMEKAGVAFVNQLGLTPFAPSEAAPTIAPPADELPPNNGDTAAHVRQALAELLAPALGRGLDGGAARGKA
ncbi:MAG: MotA/TolQ/ExbB proton channel family protein [Planctomycetes bacterium]|nr:MotA/TolQ/ExbB proton channel family protein [Planctomycetota bacterium]